MTAQIGQLVLLGCAFALHLLARFVETTPPLEAERRLVPLVRWLLTAVLFVTLCMVAWLGGVS